MKTGIYWQDPKYAVGVKRCHADPSCVLHLPLYRLDGASFMSQDAYGHLATATGALWTPKSRFFDGLDDKIVIPDHDALDITEVITILAWVRLAKLTGNAAVVTKRPGAAEYNYYLRVDSGYVRFSFYNGGHKSLEDDTTRLAVGEWTLVGVTYDRVKIRLFVNASEVKNAAETLPMIADSYELSIGKDTYGVGSNELEGDIGELWVYNRALNPLEIQHHYLAGKWRYR